jgi:hypothetical protein
MSAAEAAGYTPVIAITADSYGMDNVGGWGGNSWPSGANTPVNPTDADYKCGMNALLNYLSSHGVLRSPQPIETYNEPGGGIGSACEPANGFSAYQCAAQYWTDAYAEDVRAMGRGDTLIAGTFSSATSGNTNSGQCSSSNFNGNTYVNASGGFDWNYGCATDILTGAYGYPRPTSWSFHDYQDVDNSDACVYNSGSGCTTGQAVNYKLMLSNLNLSYNDIWMTEAGVWLNGHVASGGIACKPSGTGCNPANGNALYQAHEAEEWKYLANNSPVAHAFYYEFQTAGDIGGSTSTGNDGFDSALLGINNNNKTENGILAPDPNNPSWGGNSSAVPRPSYCVLAFGDSYTGATTDTRCNPGGGFASSPENPLTDWEIPG